MKTRGSPALRICPHRIHLLLVFVLGLITAGCTAATDTARLEAVAEAGIAYAGEVAPLLDQAFELAAAVDSGALVAARGGLSPEQRRDRLREFDAAMTERLNEYAATKRHNDLLRSYFLALRILLKPDGPKGIGNAAKRLTTELGKLSPRLKKVQMGDVSVSGLIEPAARIAVASFKSALCAASSKPAARPSNASWPCRKLWSRPWRNRFARTGRSCRRVFGRMR